MQYPLANSTWGLEEREAVIRVLDSGKTTMGSEVAAFEKQFAAHFGSKYAVMVNSGSSANLIAVGALFFTKEPLARKGSVAIVPAVSWATTYYPLSQYGLTLRFVDIDKHTLNFDMDALASAIDEDVSVIFAVNLLGNPNDYSKIQELIQGLPITLIEDNCESMGATFQGRSAGTFGKIGTYSTFFSHHMSTMEGGLCVTDDEELYHVLLSLRSHGWTRHLPWPNKLAEKDERGDFYESFRFLLPGYNVRPLEMSGALGIQQLAKLDSFVEARRANAEVFVEQFSNLAALRIQREIGESSWFGFSLVLTPEAKISRDNLIALLNSSGVETRPIVAGNFARNPVIKYMDHDQASIKLPNAEEIDERGLYIGNHHWDVRDEIRQIREIVGKVL